MDFEGAVWVAVCSVFPQAVIQGCAFNWTQAVWRKVQALGLSVPYTDNRATRNFIRQLMALSFLPATYTERTFNELEARVQEGQLKELDTYVRNT